MAAATVKMIVAAVVIATTDVTELISARTETLKQRADTGVCPYAKTQLCKY